MSESTRESESRAALVKALAEIPIDITAAREAGIIDASSANAALSHIGSALRILRDARVASGDVPAVPLSEFFRWPTQRTPCPKCGGIKEGKRRYLPGPIERVQHTCACGFYLFTKTEDQSDV